jgi:hypothetical protein
MKSTKKYIGDIASSRERSIVYFIVLELGVVGKNGRKKRFPNTMTFGLHSPSHEKTMSMKNP